MSDIDATRGLLVFSYPKGELVGEVTVPSGYPAGLCPDSAGNVFVTTANRVSQSYIYEYAHGGTQPIATLSDPGQANGCAVDPKTGNLAVTNYLVAGSSSGDVAIFLDAKGTPSTYFDPQIPFYLYCAYDSNGNLYADGGNRAPANVIGELPAGSSTFSNITLTKNVGPISIQWVGDSFIVSGSDVQSKFGPQPIYKVRLSQGVGKVSGPILLRSPHNLNPYEGVQFWMQGHTLIGPDRKGPLLELVNFWHYPSGGWPKKIIRRPGGAINLHGVTVSRANAESARVPYLIHDFEATAGHR